MVADDWVARYKSLQALGWLTTAFALTAVETSAESMTAEDIYAQVLPSIVTLKVENSKGELFTGTAFLAIATNVGVTAWHVVHDAVRVTALFADGEQRPVYGIIDKSAVHDVALISLEGGTRPLLKLAQTPPRVGSRTYVIGAPRGFGFSIADGLLSQIQEVDGVPQYQVSCPFSTGSSGSPVLNGRAEAIGTATWSKLHAQNLNFAVPSSIIAQLNPHLPSVPWLQQDQRILNAASSQPTEAVRVQAPDLDSELEALRETLRTAAGQTVTIVIQRTDGPERSFRFTVPPLISAHQP